MAGTARHPVRGDASGDLKEGGPPASNHRGGVGVVPAMDDLGAAKRAADHRRKAEHRCLVEAVSGTRAAAVWKPHVAHIDSIDRRATRQAAWLAGDETNSVAPFDQSAAEVVNLPLGTSSDMRPEVRVSEENANSVTIAPEFVRRRLSS